MAPVDVIDDFYRFVGSLPKNRLCILHVADNIDRKKLHTFLEDNYPKISKTSLSSTLFSQESASYLKNCWCCNKKCVELTECDWQPEIGIDARMSGTCPHCNEYVVCEFYFDRDNYFYLLKNNIIVIGNYLRNYSNKRKKSISVTQEEIANILLKSNKYVIDSPEGVLRKKNLQEHIDSQLKLM